MANLVPDDPDGDAHVASGGGNIMPGLLTADGALAPPGGASILLDAIIDVKTGEECETATGHGRRNR